jgi:hypothetical protein
MDDNDSSDDEIEGEIDFDFEVTQDELDAEEASRQAAKDFNAARAAEAKEALAIAKSLGGKPKYIQENIDLFWALCYGRAHQHRTAKHSIPHHTTPHHTTTQLWQVAILTSIYDCKKHNDSRFEEKGEAMSW